MAMKSSSRARSQNYANSPENLLLRYRAAQDPGDSEAPTKILEAAHARPRADYIYIPATANR